MTVKPLPLRGSCNGCGACCDPVRVTFDRDGLLRVANDIAQGGEEPDGSPCSNRNPRVRRWLLFELTPRATAGEHSCVNFDAATRRCLAYDDRPGVCSEFPWYGERPRARDLDFLPECGYHIDVPAEAVPDPLD